MLTRLAGRRLRSCAWPWRTINAVGAAAPPHTLATAPTAQHLHVASASHLDDCNERAVRVAFDDGTVSQFHAVWLRDHCLCGACTDSRTRQRTKDTYDFLTGTGPQVRAARVDPSTRGLAVEWIEGGRGHTSVFPAGWLAAHAYWSGGDLNHSASLTGCREKDVATDPSRRVLWGADTFGSRHDAHGARRFPSVTFDAYMADDGALATSLRMMRDYGFVMVEGLPVTGVQTADVALTDTALRRIGFLKETLYGAGTWCVAVKPPTAADNNDTAFSTVSLPAHTDGNYWSDPAGVQSFHCISPDAGGGGVTLLVDGFAIAEQLRASHPATFDFLRAFRVPYHHTEPATVMAFSRPVISLGDRGEVTAFHFNNDDRAPFTPILPPYGGGSSSGASGASAPPALDPTFFKPSLVPTFYAHLRVLLSALRSPSAEVWVPLQPGTLLIFDNTRVLHGRSALSSSSCGRVLTGAYMDADTWRGRLRALEAAAAAAAAAAGSPSA